MTHEEPTVSVQVGFEPVLFAPNAVIFDEIQLVEGLVDKEVFQRNVYG